MKKRNVLYMIIIAVLAGSLVYPAAEARAQTPSVQTVSEQQLAQQAQQEAEKQLAMQAQQASEQQQAQQEAEKLLAMQAQQAAEQQLAQQAQQEAEQQAAEQLAMQAQQAAEQQLALQAQQAAEQQLALQAQQEAEKLLAIQAQQAAEQQLAIQAQQAAEQQQAAFASLSGKTVSIIGDSISTFEGYIPSDYVFYYPGDYSQVKKVEDTWWMKMIATSGMRLGTNASYSASTICGDSASTTKGSAACSNRRIADLISADGRVPDIIIIAMGMNDFLKSNDIGGFNGVPTPRGDHYISNVTEAYELTIQKLQRTYPNAKIYCSTIIETNAGDSHGRMTYPSINGRDRTVADYNKRIKEIAAAYGLPVIDFHECGITYYNLNNKTDDGVHPNISGSQMMADIALQTLLQF